MNNSPLVKYGSGNLSADETYTIELLIDAVQWEFDPHYFENEDSEARECPDYQPSFKPEHLKAAAPLLESKTWLSLQRIRGDQRPVRDLTALQYLQNLNGLVLIDNEVSDLTPIGKCTKLRRLILSSNPIGDISPLRSIHKLVELTLTDTAVEDLSVLESLAELTELWISGAQVAALRKLSKLTPLRKLHIHGAFDSFDGFPEMPNLRSITGAEVKSLEGLNRMTRLENLVNLEGQFDSLAPLSELRNLTHCNVLSSRITSVKPLAKLVAMRVLRLKTTAPTIDLRPLTALPALHELSVTCDDQEPASMAEICADLTSWDLELLADTPRFRPSLRIEVIGENAFEHFDTNQPYGVAADGFDEALLSAELDWLVGKLKLAIEGCGTADDDYCIPHRPAVSRSLSIVLLSADTIAAFPKLVLQIQEVLASLRNDFIIYFQSDFGQPHCDDFIVWIYPDKIQVTEQFADTVQRLICPTG